MRAHFLEHGALVLRDVLVLVHRHISLALDCCTPTTATDAKLSASIGVKTAGFGVAAGTLLPSMIRLATRKKMSTHYGFARQQSDTRTSWSTDGVHGRSDMKSRAHPRCSYPWGFQFQPNVKESERQTLTTPCGSYVPNCSMNKQETTAMHSSSQQGVNP